MGHREDTSGLEERGYSKATKEGRFISLWKLAWDYTVINTREDFIPHPTGENKRFIGQKAEGRAGRL